MRVLSLLLFTWLVSAAVIDKTKYQFLTPSKADVATLTADNLEPLTVHMIAHTHDDVGWLKTVDEYYFGEHNDIQVAGVQYIISNIVDILRDHPERKFIYVEIAFFERWWNEQDEEKKTLVRRLVKTGQLEFINGGWCMNDEATSHFSASLDQMTFGHQFLLKEFGITPRIGWQIDPFGHSATQAKQFSNMGYDAFFTNRIDFRDHNWRVDNREMEFIWRNSDEFGRETDIWAHEMFAHYCYLGGTFWDWPSGQNDPVQDDPKLDGYNVDSVAKSVADQLRGRIKAYKHNHILMPLGCDFTFMNPALIYTSMEKLLKYFKAHPEFKLNFKWSTPSIYVDDVNAQNITFNIKTGDFMPYCSGGHSCWTGYYTSRSNLKGYARDMSNLAHTADKALVASSLGAAQKKAAAESLRILDDAYGVVQHHDAISGTEKQAVAFDYAKRLHRGQVAAYDVLSQTLSATISNDTAAPVLDFVYCPLVNESSCPILEGIKGQAVAVVFYNPLARNTPHRVTLPVTYPKVKVTDSNGNRITSEVLPNPEKSGTFTLFFVVKLPALGHNTYFISADESADMPNVDTPTAETNVLQNDYYTITFGADNRLQSISLKDNSVNILQDFLVYKSNTGDSVDGQSSGAYVFRPEGDAMPVSNKNPTLEIKSGNMVQEVHQVWSEQVSQTIRIFSDSPFIQFTSTVKPLNTSDGGRELIFRLNTSMATEGIWYSDSQGLEMIKRQANMRGNWNFTFLNYESVSFNYAPINEAVRMSDGKLDLTILTDRSRGGASIGNGAFEVMLQRRILRDDGFGVAEALNEDITVTGSLWLSLSETAESGRLQRVKSLDINNAPTAAFLTVPSDFASWSKGKVLTQSFLSAALPSQVHLLNLRMISQGQILLRLHHILATGESAEAVPVKLDLARHFAGLKIKNVLETTVTGNQPLKEVNKLKWKVSSNQEPKYQYVPISGTVITMRPMETRTFVVTV